MEYINIPIKLPNRGSNTIYDSVPGNMKILFVCRGNTGRSQMAEAIFLHMAGDRHEAKSAGTKVESSNGARKEGQKIKDLDDTGDLISSLHEIGVDISDNVRKQITPHDVDWADKVIVMAEPDTLPDFLKNSSKTEYWNVENPKGADLQKMNDIRDHIIKLVKNLLTQLK